MTTVTLRWDDPEAAGDFLRLREEYRRDGYLTDPASDVLRELVGESEVVDGGSDEEAGDGGGR